MLRAGAALGSSQARVALCTAVLPMLLIGVSATLASAPGASHANAQERVLVLGDSISAAYGMSLEQGWVALLEARLLDSGADLEIINASISGDTSAGGLRRLPELLARHQPAILIVELGGNDGLRGYPSNKLRDNLAAMVRLGRAAGAQVLVLPMEIPPNYGPRYTEAFREAYTQAASAEGARLGPFILENIATVRELMQADGIHPTIAAQAMIADSLQPILESMLAGESLARGAQTP